MSSGIKGCVTLIFILLVQIHGWRPFTLHVDELISESLSSKCRVNSSVTYPGLLNMNVEILESVKSTYSAIELFLQSLDGKYDLEIVNRTIDLCRLFRDVTYEPILQVGLRLYKSNPNFIKSCFIKKGNYSLKNLKLNVEKLPPFFPEKNGYFSQTYLLDKTRKLFKVKLFFSVNKAYNKSN